MHLWDIDQSNYFTLSTLPKYFLRVNNRMIIMCMKIIVS